VTLRERRRPLLLALLGVALFAGAVGIAHRIRVAGERPYDVSFVPSAASLRWLSLGHPTLAANLFWLRAVQYMGDPHADARGWEKLRPLVDVVTDLDPRHGYAYQTTGNMLASAGRLDDSNAILEKGTRNVPDRYILPFHRAVNAFMYAGDYVDAGKWFEIASRAPGAPARLREYVVAMYAKADRSEAAVSFLRHLREEAQDDESRKAIDHQLQRATLERDANRLEAAAETFRERTLLAPFCLEQLVLAGLVPSIPEDPFGGVYWMDGEGRVRSSVYDQRLDRPETPEQRERTLREYRVRLNTAGKASR
jgi:tetratricopeptide (TPR) repeat protein